MNRQIGQPIKHKTADELFFSLRQDEEKTFQGLRQLLGTSFEFTDELLKLYEEFFGLLKKPIARLNDQHQLPALLHCLQWMRNDAIAALMSLMRGHISDSRNFTRRALEIAAFVAHIYKKPEAAAIWMEAGTSEEAGRAYIDEFRAYRLVTKYLPKGLVEFYNGDCLDVHPSLSGACKRAVLGNDYVHRFSYQDLDPTDPNQTYFVMKFFLVFIYHGQIMDFLAQSGFNANEHFDLTKWNALHETYGMLFAGMRTAWKPVIDEHFAEMDKEIEAEERAALRSGIATTSSEAK